MKNKEFNIHSKKQWQFTHSLEHAFYSKNCHKEEPFFHPRSYQFGNEIIALAQVLPKDIFLWISITADDNFLGNGGVFSHLRGISDHFFMAPLFTKLRTTQEIDDFIRESGIHIKGTVNWYFLLATAIGGQGGPLGGQWPGGDPLFLYSVYRI